MSETADVCVVGSGAGGALAAWALVKRGARVLLLEVGPRFVPADYTTYVPDWELQRSRFAEVSAAKARESYEGRATQLDPAYADLHSRTPSFYARRPARRRRRSFFYNHAIGVGGSTLHYQGEAHRFPAHAFRMRSERGVAEDWPIRYAELAPFYARVEALLGVAGDPENPFKPAREAYPYPAHPLSAASQRVAEGARRLGWRLLPNSVAILPRARPGRAACHYCNGCARGCMVGAKGSVDVAVIPEAEATGRLRLVTGFQVSRLQTDADGRAVAALGFDAEGREGRHLARAFVLATGAIETPRILLNSAGGAHPHGIGNAEDQVGRNLMETLYAKLLAHFERPLDTWAGLPLDSRIWDLNGASGEGEVPNGMVLGQGVGVLEGPVGHALEGLEGYGAEHREGMRKSFGAGIEFLGIAEQLPQPENRVTLSQRKDRFGVPLASVLARLREGDFEALAHLHGQIGALADASRVAQVVGQVSAFDTPNATHVGGTCRMGSDRKTSVVDAHGRVWGVPNLVVADASVLVTQGAGDSPSLTIQALALRAAEELAERARRGEV